MLKKIAIVVAMLAVTGAGCGGSEGEVSDDVASLTMSIASIAGSQAVDVSGYLLDASSGTQASISGSPDAIADTADSTCDWAVSADPAGKLLGSGNIGLGLSAVSIEHAKSTCTNQSNCVWCYMSDNDSLHYCSLQCEGAIAVNNYTPGNYFDAVLLATHTFTTEMEGDGEGMIRIDGEVNYGDGTDDLTYVMQDFQQTQCSNADVVLVEDEGNVSLTGLTVGGDSYDSDSADGVWHEFYEITTSTASESIQKVCVVKDVVTVRCTVPLTLTGGTSIDCATSTWSNTASICEGQDNCDAYSSGN